MSSRRHAFLEQRLRVAADGTLKQVFLPPPSDACPAIARGR